MIPTHEEIEDLWVEIERRQAEIRLLKVPEYTSPGWLALERIRSNNWNRSSCYNENTSSGD